MENALVVLLNGAPLAPDRAGVVEAVGFAEWAPIEIALDPVAGALAARLRLGGEELGPPATTPFDPRWRWRWLPRGVAGLVHGNIEIGLASGTLSVALRLELRPRLLDQRTWAALIDDLATLAQPLAVALGGAAFAHATLLPLRDHDLSPLEAALVLLDGHVGRLGAIAEGLARDYDTVLARTEASEPLGARRSPEPLDPADPWQELAAAPAARPELRDRLPAIARAAHAAASHDLPEHRWLLGMIVEVERRARRLRALLEAEQGRSERYAALLAPLAVRLNQALERLRRLRGLQLLVGLVPRLAPPRQSQRLVRDQRYRPLRGLWHELRATPWLTLYAGDLALPLADLPTLYERWAVLRLAQSLASGPWPITAQSLLAEDATQERWELRLSTAAPLLTGTAPGGAWALRYQPRYGPVPDAGGLGSLDGYVRIPDAVLELRAPSGATKLLVFDAKYRRAPDGRVPQDALDDAYAYRGSIGAGGVALVEKALILYPGDGVGDDFGAVGALCLAPGRAEPLRQYLERFLEE